MPLVYRKTTKGQREIETRADRLLPRLRTALILADGRRGMEELRKLVPGDPDDIYAYYDDPRPFYDKRDRMIAHVEQRMKAIARLDLKPDFLRCGGWLAPKRARLSSTQFRTRSIAGGIRLSPFLDSVHIRRVKVGFVTLNSK